MKNLSTRNLKYLIMCFMLLSVYSSKAQYVTIPDANFITWLSTHGYSQCLSGSQLDTACAAVTNATMVDCSSASIADLTGIQYFHNLKQLYCEINNLSTLPSPLPTGLLSLYCGGSVTAFTSLPSLPSGLDTLDTSFDYNLASLPSLPPGLISLNSTGNDLTAVPALPSALTNLEVSSNQLTSLPALPSGLLSLDISTNQFTSVPALPAGLVDLAISNNTAITTMPPLPVGLIGLSYSNCPVGNLPSFPAGVLYLWCDGSGTTLLPALPSQLSLLVCSNNQLISLPAIPASVYTLECDHNQLTSIPALGGYLEDFYCNNNPPLACLPVLPVINTLQFYGTAVTCLPNYGTVSNSNPPLASLPLCNIFNSHGCNIYWNMAGNIFYDSIGNCTFGTGDKRQALVKVKLFDNSGNLLQQTYTGGEGLYSFHVNNFGTYTTQIDTAQLPFTVGCPDTSYYTSVISASDSMWYGEDFALKCRATGYDVGTYAVITNNVVPRPGSVVTVNALTGDISDLFGAHCAAGISGQVSIAYSGPVTFSSMAPNALTPTNIAGNTLTWTIPDYGIVNDSIAFGMIFSINSNATPGSSVCFAINVTPAANDYNLSNNDIVYCFPVVDALDPNEKEVYPAGTIDTSVHWLTYTIRFQNTGTAAAENISVADTLDTNLDVSTFELLSASAKAYTQINGNVVTFDFPNINLPDSVTSDSASRGYVQYKVKINNNITPGVQISNTAYIYFDLNSAVVTNTVVDTISSLPSGITQLTDNSSISLYPNPTTDQLYIQTQNIQPISTTIYDVNGQMIYTMPFKPMLYVNQLSSGVYFIEVVSNEGVARKKFVKM